MKTVPQQSKPDPAQNTPTSSVPSHHYKQQQHRKSVEAAKKNLEIQKKAQELLHKQIGQQKVSCRGWRREGVLWTLTLDRVNFQGREYWKSDTLIFVFCCVLAPDFQT